MNELFIAQLNQEAEEKAIFCELSQYLFDADLMIITGGTTWREITLDRLY